jgi:S1 RNA binding domain protein
MDFEVGTILTGKVTGITKFGAFVTIAPGQSGLVHISEIANTYVSDISSHLIEGQDVTVKVIGVDQSGRMSLSIKAAAPAPTQTRQHQSPSRSVPRFSQKTSHKPTEPVVPPTFEDKLKRFMHDSDSKMSGIKQYSDKKGARRRGR